jgi:hypothetical protein
MARYPTFAALCLAAWPLPAQPQPPAAGTPGLGEQVRRDLESLFQPGAWLETNVAPYQQTAARARLRTRPYATSIVGLCRRDEVIVDYGGPRPFADNAAANAVAPYGVRAEGWYRVLRDIPYAGYDGPPREGECTMLSGAETRGWFVAPDVSVAWDGHRALIAAVRQFSERRGSIAGCREDRASREGCHRMFVGTAPGQVVRIEHCLTAVQQQRFCYRLTYDEDTGTTMVTLRLHYDGRGEPRIDAVAIQWPDISI